MGARQAGFTFLEMLVLMVLMSILGAYAIMRMQSAGENTVWYQAHHLARDIRHMQVLTTTWGRPLQITATSTGYSVSCVTAGTTPCDVSPILDPVTGAPFSVSFSHGVTLTASGTNPVGFDLHGRSINSSGTLQTGTTTYTLNASGTTAAVAVSPVTGFVGVTP